MLLTKRIDIRINRNSVQHYTDLGYKFKMWEYINVPIEHIIRGSKCLVDVKCDNCGTERKMEYRVYCDITKELTEKYFCYKCCKEHKTKNTNLEKYGCENPFQNKNIKDKIKKTNIKKYGVENVMFNNDIKKKMKSIFIEKYGVENPFQNEIIKKKIKQKEKEIKNKIKITRIKNNNQIPDNMLTEFEKYKKIVCSETEKNKKLLLEKWNGFDYYDKEYIKDNKNLNYNNSNYPTIDHKISVTHGFINNINPCLIGDINNLCITKRGINSSKHKKTEKEFYETFNHI